MDSVEFEALLSDVETKLDRLKALYEQWFQGIERLEPSIARKDIERRMVLLRKEQPRNTALRFRFQQIVMRFTTLQTYWGRVSRQIEEGTYRRDLMKARQSMLASRAGRKRSADTSFEVDLDAFEDGLGGGVDPLTTSTVPQPPSAPPEVSIPPPPRAAPSPNAPPRPVLSPIAPPRPVVPGAPAAPRVVSPFARPAPRAPGAPAPPPPPALPNAAQSPPPPPATATFAKPATHGAAPPSAPQSAAQSPTPATATFARPGGAPRPATQAPTSFAKPGETATPARPAAPVAAPIATPIARPAAPPVAVPIARPAAPPIAAPVARPAAPPVAQPAPAARPAPAAPTAHAPAAPRTAESLSEQDLRRVYDRYSEARRRNNEPVVSYDALAKNLRDVAPKMREKYGKPVDFEVVLKDGKVGLKPVPKG